MLTLAAANAVEISREASQANTHVRALNLSVNREQKHGRVARGHRGFRRQPGDLRRRCFAVEFLPV